MRTRVNERFAGAARFPIALVVAPAGYGKSVALGDFLSSEPIEAVRFDVRREDDTFLAFVRRLCDAIEPLAPKAASSFAAFQEHVLAAGEPARLACDWLAEHLKLASGAIAIDDLHFAAGDPSTMAFVSYLMERTSDRIRWIVASRSDGGLPVATWLAYGRMERPIDADDLRLTLDEAVEAANVHDASIPLDVVERLWHLTQGWPVAFAIALRTRAPAGELRGAATREMVYRYLAEQVLSHVSSAQSDFLLSTSVFATFDMSIAQRLGGTVEFMAELRQGVAFLTETAPGEYRYHDLFRDFLESELRRRGDDAWRAALISGGTLLEERHRAAAALALYTKAEEYRSMLRIVERDGFALFERGQADTLSTALRALPDEVRRASAAALGLQATIEAARGLFDPANRGFIAAIERADRDDLRLTLVHRYAIELVRQGGDCIGLLDVHANDERAPAALRAPLLGTLATAYTRAARADEALRTIATALDLMEPAAADEIRARLYQQAAYVHSQESDYDAARRYATLAVDLALAHDLYDVAVRAYSVLYQIAWDDADDPIACLAILDKLLDCARKGASTQGILFGLMAGYGIEADRGDEAALDRIEKQLAEIPGVLPQTRNERLLSIAQRAGWHGEFQQAYALVAQAGDLQNDEWRADHFANAALYACAAGMHEEVRLAIAAASAALARWGRPTRTALVARLFLVFAELLRARPAAAHRHLTYVRRNLDSAMHRLAAFAQAATVYYRRAVGQSDPEHVAVALERLRAEHYGGIARLLEALPFPKGAAGGYATLTAAEREILQMLAAGKSTKDMARRTSRSPRTIDTHIRSICKKLGCHSRRAVVALAIGSDWIRSEASQDAVV